MYVCRERERERPVSHLVSIIYLPCWLKKDGEKGYFTLFFFNFFFPSLNLVYCLAQYSQP